MRTFDPEKALAWARALSFPRLVGTPGEIQGRDFIRRALGEIGLESRESPFRFYPALSFGILKFLIGVGLLLLVAQRILLSTTPRLGVLAGLAIPLVARALWRRYRRASAEKLEDRRADYPLLGAFAANAGWQLRSANLIADLPVRGEIRRRVVLSGHTDTKSQNMSIVTRGICSILLAIGLYLLPLLLTPGVFWPGYLTGALGTVWWVLWLLAVISALILLTMKVTNESPGAMDNAGSCALLLETARNLVAEPPEGVAVRVLFTGGEELGLAGAYHYARTLVDEPHWRDAVHLNYEGVGGASKLLLATGSGPGKQTENEAERALQLAEAACRRAGHRARRLARLVGGEADHIPLLEAGLAAVTFMFSGKKGVNVHTAGDRPELLTAPDFDVAGQITLAAIEILEEEAS